MCTTNWGEILKVDHISGRQISVSDPNAIDAGMIIFDDEIKCLWKVVLLDSRHPPMYTDMEWAKLKSVF
jgi:hypothetical protein